MKTLLRRNLVRLMRCGLALPPAIYRPALRDMLHEAMEDDGLSRNIVSIPLPDRQMQLVCIGKLAKWRAETLFTKEPETIAWIDGFSSTDVLWDIGANVGIYSVYAAVSRGVRVCAFEPSAANYFLLNRNIEINRLERLVTAYCLALADKTGFGHLDMTTTEFAGALSNFSTSRDSGQAANVNFQQGMVGMSIDHVLETSDLPFPNHIKIDVDGIEPLIVAGATATLSDARLKSVSVEMDDKQSEIVAQISNALAAAGMTLARKLHGKMFDSGPHSSIFNYHFERSR